MQSLKSSNGLSEIFDFVVYRCDKGRKACLCIYVKDIFKVIHVEVNITTPRDVEGVGVCVCVCVWVAVQS